MSKIIIESVCSLELWSRPQPRRPVLLVTDAEWLTPRYRSCRGAEAARSATRTSLSGVASIGRPGASEAYSPDWRLPTRGRDCMDSRGEIGIRIGECGGILVEFRSENDH